MAYQKKKERAFFGGWGGSSLLKKEGLNGPTRRIMKLGM